MPDLDEPPYQAREPVLLLLDYLDFYRNVVVRKLRGLAPAQLSSTRVPSGWTPIELLRHLAYMERRWFEWGFAGVAVDHPWGDADPRTGRWVVPQDTTFEEVVGELEQVAVRTRELTSSSSLEMASKAGGRFTSDGELPTLHWIFLHVLQEYARHAGHLDIVRELSDGSIGE
jgi:hypothetical protein